jgi:hypothetical protein
MIGIMIGICWAACIINFSCAWADFYVIGTSGHPEFFKAEFRKHFGLGCLFFVAYVGLELFRLSNLGLI